MWSGKRKPRHGGNRLLRAFTLVEVVISILIIMVLVNGVLGYQYFSTHDVRLSEVQASGARLGLLLLESWKAGGGPAGFDPVAQFGDKMKIEAIAGGPAVPDGEDAFIKQGSYGVRMANTYYFVTLSQAEANEQEPQALSVIVAWKKDYSAGDLTGEEANIPFSAFVSQP
ncbi:MAG: hypothetical protein LLF76_05215 [Planctomycetaceae bacterium]|nr:hypothetical protein [Planctomycetaceae bacterium]